MALLQEIPLKNNIPNQSLSTIVNNQTITIELFTYNNILFCNIYLRANLIAAGVKCNHGVYLNQYITNLVGYLFFYDDNYLNPTYHTLGTTSHLYYSDYDILALDYEAWVNKNIAYLYENYGI